MDSLSLICEVLEPLAGRRVLDIGCGPGFLAKALLARSAEVTGIDPAEHAITAARATAPAASFMTASGASLPFEDAEFDAAIFLNSLHHFPRDAMSAALAESARVTRPEGFVIVIEPLALGSFFEAFRVIEDETEVRRLAQVALERSLTDGVLVRTRSVTYDRRERFESLDQFLVRAAAADRSRESPIRERRAEIERGFATAAARDSEGRYILDQPLKADILRRPDAIGR
jgi:ubiquinone/menaquinone biosynthesis C-methylase UbiE